MRKKEYELTIEDKKVIAQILRNKTSILAASLMNLEKSKRVKSNFKKINELQNEWVKLMNVLIKIEGAL